MELQERAKEILEFFNKIGHRFESNLVKSDMTNEKKEEKFLFWKIKTDNLCLTDRLSNQIINYYNIRDYRKSLKSYLERNSSKTQGFLIFETERKVDEQGFEDAKMLYSLCNNILSIYENKADTEKFDKVAGEVANFLQGNLKREPWGDYGVVFAYVIEVMPKISEENKKWITSVNKFADKLISQKRTKIEESDLEA